MSGTQKDIFPNFLLNSEMAVVTDLGEHFPDSLNYEQDFDYELSSLYTPQSSDDSILSIQLLEFKTSLLEAVEELHIHRDGEMHFEEQINKFVVEKQELEWEKESLQHQIDTLVRQHNESLAAQKKQFQERIAEIEGEKGKHQLSAELKDREIVRLKEEVKVLQLFKYSLQKKLSELEQKMQLQAQAKDGHLSQLGEVERRFAALSRLCASVKQAHDKLVQNVEEALRCNRKLMIVNIQQEKTIKSLKQDVHKANSEVIKSKVSSACKSGEEITPHIVKEQQMQQLQHRLKMETEMNKQLMKENAAVMAEKQEVMTSLLQAQQLLQTQTEALNRAEQELQQAQEEAQSRALQEARGEREEHEALKTEHKLFQEKILEQEGQIDSLMGDRSRTVAEWKNEEKILQEKLNAEREELTSVKEAYGCLHEKYKQLSLSPEHRQEGEAGLTELQENAGTSEARAVGRRETKDRPEESTASPAQAEPVELRVHKQQGPSACDEMGADRHTPDKVTGPGPGEPTEMETKEGPLAYHLQTAAVPPPPAGLPATGALAAIGGGVAGRERGLEQLQSPGGVESRAHSLPDKGSSPSARAPHCADCDPVGGPPEVMGQEDAGCVPRNQTADEHGGGGQETPVSERSESRDAIAFEADLDKGSLGLPETSHSVTPYRPVEHHGGTSHPTSGANKAGPDTDPLSPEGLQNSASASDVPTAADAGGSPFSPSQPVTSPPEDPPSSFASSVREQEEARGSDGGGRWKTAADDVPRRAGAVDPNAEPDPGSVSPPALSRRSGITARRVRGPELLSSRRPTAAPSGESELKGGDGAGVGVFEADGPNGESPSSTHPGTADTTETLDAARVPPESAPRASERPRKEGKPPHGEPAVAYAPRIKRLRSSFGLEPLAKARGPSTARDFLGLLRPLKGDQANGHISRPLTPPIPSFLKTKTQLPPGFQGFLSPLKVSLLQRDEPSSGDPPAAERPADVLNAPGLHAGRRRDPPEEWSEAAETAGPEKAEAERAHIPGRPARAWLPASSPAGIQSPRPSPPGHTAEGGAVRPGSEGTGPSQVSARISEAERPELPRKRKGETEESKGHTSTNEP